MTNKFILIHSNNMVIMLFLISLLFVEALDIPFSLKCAISKIKLEDPLDFSFRIGYQDAIFPYSDSSSEYAKIVRDRET